jgi:hypothetical protein
MTSSPFSGPENCEKFSFRGEPEGCGRAGFRAIRDVLSVPVGVEAQLVEVVAGLRRLAGNRDLTLTPRFDGGT